ncbi:3-ketoacyl-ACP reductase (plasmid) [Antarctobacter heliothermus]|uniref:3-ketoacyl-ACP reductase n=1 Tax=Antarctobacter heliothermus TaxID=74033 RepID=A0A222EAY7_9RHOB|nr:SDR family oxidoreductase [Antarctobacter heliothermus]ASP23356.1 3-ketoacyl-ACP reductase [Antarctobacter heliothermus]
MNTPRFLSVDLTGRRVLITGAASGIGRVIAEGFLAAGARVHVCDVSDDALGAMAREQPGIGASKADVSDPEAVAGLFDRVEAEFGGLDILVNNAGIAGPTGPVQDIDAEELRRTMAVDVEAMFHCCARAVPLMQNSGGGRVVNLASVAGRLSYSNRTPYAAAKWGVIGFTKSLALEVGRDGIRVNAILPGHVNTSRFRAVVERRAATLGITPQEMEREVLAPVALGSTVECEDIANMALYLCSSFGGAVTGQALSVCGGVEMMR